MPSAQVQSQSASRQGSKAQNTLAPLDKTPRFVLLIGYLEGNSFYLKSTFTKFFQEKKKMWALKDGWNHCMILPDDLKTAVHYLPRAATPHSTNQLNRKC